MDEMAKLPSTIFEKLWHSGEVPTDFKWGNIAPISPPHRYKLYSQFSTLESLFLRLVVPAQALAVSLQYFYHNNTAGFLSPDEHCSSSLNMRNW